MKSSRQHAPSSKIQNTGLKLFDKAVAMQQEKESAQAQLRRQTVGTNYYWTSKANECSHCGRFDSERLHIGKSSAGWTFTLHVYPERDINDLPDWQELLVQPFSFIEDEYENILSKEEMLDTITNREWKPWDEREWPSYAYDSEAHFHRVNHSKRGPNGLARPRIDGAHCIGHGEGTWTLMVGEFS